MHIYPDITGQKLGFESVIAAASGYCRSEMGVEEMQALKPVGHIGIIERELGFTREMMAMLSGEEAVPLEHPFDIREAARRSRVERAVLDGESMLKICKFSATSRILKLFVKNRAETYPALALLSQEIIPLKDLEQAIEKVISEQGTVRDNASSALQQIRKSLNSRRNDLRVAIDKIIRRSSKDGHLAEQEPTIRNGRLVIPVKAEHKRKFNGFIQDVSATGQTVYMEPAEALHINNDIRELEKQELREVERLLMQLTADIGHHHKTLLYNASALGKFDAIMARAAFCHFIDGVIPELSESGELFLSDAKNPVLILKNKNLKKDQREKIIPLNLRMEPDEKGLIITGPNAGGKSVALKTIGICQVMVQSGFAIPAREDSVIPVCDAVFLDMGDEQSIDDDLSTFSSRLQWIRETMKNAGAKSLVLVDEAGTGTDPEEGVALYQAFMEEMVERGCRIIATTHHGNLKVFAHNHEEFVNASMEFDQENLSPTYIFKKGVPGSSYAFEIGGRTGISDKLLKRARELVGSSKNRLESLILDMENKAQQAEQIRLDLTLEKAKTNKLKKEFEQRLSSIKNERDKLREKALSEAKDIMMQANARIEEAVQRVYESKGDKEAIKDIRENIEKFRDGVETRLEQTTERRKSKSRVFKEPPLVGDAVKLLDTNSVGELLEISGKQAVVDVNGLRVKTKFKNLAKTEKPAKKKSGYTLTTPASESYTSSPVRHSLDIRGFRGEAAIRELTFFLDRAISARLNNVEIIHGKGDGILKKMVHEELSRRKDVKSYDLAPWEQGGPGCTLAEL